MAARPDDAKAEITDLRQTKGSDLETLLEEERKAWREAIHWDFSASADLIRRYVDMRALNGVVLRVNRRPAGYAYHVAEESKTLIGNLFVTPPLATPEVEHRLLHATLADAFEHGARRVEAQLMMLRHRPEHGRLAQSFPGLSGRTFRRYFMLAPLGEVAPAPAPAEMMLETWDEQFADDAARLIAGAYRSHIDSEINDQYRTVAGSRRFLANIVLYPGCGVFQNGASFAALHRSSAEVCGISLASVVAPATGHITQICVSPAAQHSGVGAALLTRSLIGLRHAGCREVSLTVTANNVQAVRLYERLHFRVLREFAAYVWERSLPQATRKEY